MFPNQAARTPGRPSSRATGLPLLLVLLLLSALALPLAAQPPGAPETVPATDSVLVETAPVVVDGRPLFDVRGVSSYPAPRRAALISGRIREAASDQAVEPEAIKIVSDELATNIVAGDVRLMAIVDADAAVDGIERQLLAEIFLAKIREAIVAYRADRTRDALLGSAWRAAAATVLAALALFLVGRSFRWLRARLERRFSERVRQISVRSFDVVREERIWRAVGSVARFATALFVILLLFLYLRYALALFPWTRGIAMQLGSWLVTPVTRLANGFVAILPNLFFLAVLFVLVRWALRLIRHFFGAAGRGDTGLKGFDPEWADPTYKLVRALVIVLAIVVAYPYIPGSNSLAFKGLSVFAGIVFSLGSTSAVANLIAGYILIYRRVYHVGDVVKIGDVFGRVTQMRLQVTHLRTIKNEEIIVPNSTIVGTDVMNYSSLAASEGLILHTTVGIGYDTPWQQVEAMLLEAAARTPGVKTEPKPFVLQLELGDFAVTHQINVYCDTARTMTATRAALHRNILDVFNEYGIQIMTPAYEGDTEQPKIVPPDKWYPAPAVKRPAAADGSAADTGAAVAAAATGARSAVAGEGAAIEPAAATAGAAIEPGAAQR
jgi:small-conductance mechanosensitive channel